MSWLSHGHQLMNFFVKAYEQRQACLGFALAKNVHQLNGTFSQTERLNMLFRCSKVGCRTTKIYISSSHHCSFRNQQLNIKHLLKRCKCYSI